MSRTRLPRVRPVLMFALLVLSPAANAGDWTVARQPIADLKAVFATVESTHEVPARARIGGTIQALALKEGDRVQAGQVLAVVRDAKLGLQLTAIDARLAALEAQHRQATTELDRARQLRAGGSGTQAKLDDAETAVEVLVAQIAAMKADRAVTEQQSKEGEILAPTTGRILRVPVVDGSFIQPGEAAAVLATDGYILRLHLPERHARFMHAGDPVLVGARGLEPMEDAAKLKAGTVSLVYPELTDGQVVADATVPDLGDYFVGERVRVLVSSGTREAMVVPDGFVVRRSGVDLVQLKGGTMVPVQPGLPVPAMPGKPGGVEILSGLNPGDVIEPVGTRL